jgi:peptidyl-prolyl cis-trans isomerase C
MNDIEVNDVTITKEAIAQEAQNHPASSPDEAWAQAAHALVVRELLLQEAKRQGLEPTTFHDESGRRLVEEDALIEEVLERELKVPDADEAVARRYYDTHLEHFRSPDIYEPAHILIAAKPDDKTAYAQAVAQAEDIIKALSSKEADFASLAQAHSDCPSKEQGGNLGQITKGQTVPEFETFLFEMEEGQLCPVPVKSRFGSHVLYLERKVEGKTVPFEAVAQKIKDYLEESTLRAASAQYISILAGQAKIKGFEMPGSDSPLVQ